MDIKSSTWLIERLRSEIELLIAHILNFELRIRHNEREREKVKERKQKILMDCYPHHRLQLS